MSRRARTRAAAAFGRVVALGLVVALCLGVALLLLGRLPERRERALVGPALVALALAGLAYEPVRRGVTASASRAIDRSVRSPEDVIATFGDRVARGVPVDDLLLELAEALRRGYRLRRAEVWTADGPRLQLAVAVPDAEPVTVDLEPPALAALGRVGTAGEAWIQMWAPGLAAGRERGRLRLAPARQASAVLGALVVERGPDDEGFGEADDLALGMLGRRLGELLRTRQLDEALRTTLEDLRLANADLRASRARLVAAADAERRRIERDLHDGAQQHLVALALNLGVARDLVATDAGAAAALLDRLAAQARATVQEVRDFARGVYPPLLIDAGLPDALHAAASRSPLDASVHAPDGGLGRGPAEAEAAVYFCCLEALQNATKHASASSVQVHLWSEGDDLRFEVADDGEGFDPATATAGHGLQNMADRIGAIGGALDVRAAPGRGTLVTGSVPWPSREDA